MWHVPYPYNIRTGAKTKVMILWTVIQTKQTLCQGRLWENLGNGFANDKIIYMDTNDLGLAT